MFDTITCHAALPIAEAVGVPLQTKGFPEPYLDLYEVRKDGSLWRKANDRDAWTPALFSGDLFVYTDTVGKWLELRMEFENGVLIAAKVEEYERD